MIRFGVLGPLRVERDGHQVPGLNALMVRRLLAALLSRQGDLVPVDDLILAHWGEDAPPTARKTLQVYVRRLRVALGEDQRISHEAAGYRISPGALDSARFAELVAAARVESHSERAADLLKEALGLWRGAAFEDVREHPPLLDEARRLDEERLRVEAEWVGIQLELGRHDEVIPHLSKLAETHPFREDIREHLMLALYRSGRQAEALELFRCTRRLLDEELGISPGPELQRLHESVLRASPELDLPARPASTVPRELPSDVGSFVGRAEHAMVGFAAARHGLGDQERAYEDACRALDSAQQSGFGVLEGQALNLLARIELDRGNATEARAQAHAALENHRRTGYRLGEADTLVVLAELEADGAEALIHRRAAEEIYTAVRSVDLQDLLLG